jgi:hypothetical protein
MPILDLPSDDAPLTQGDVLEGLPLYATGASWGERNNDAIAVKSSLCLVISRPCVVANKDSVIVAEIDHTSAGVPHEAETFEKVRAFLETLRDGLGTPDRFYLGQVPNYSQPGRFFARLDSLHTVKLPHKDQIVTLLKTRRIATLNPDFRRDLHRRVFSAFAALGFDDLNWYSDEDLRWLVQVGRQDRAKIDAQLQQQRSERLRNAASGQSNQELDGKLAKAEEKLRITVEGLRPYEAELSKREDASE